ncbi:MAG TPA: CBS domain-containing protein [Thermomicrobiales bacterium]|nr:CBS domain-containing protein [Thermomicrobiales bacterium]
MSARAAWRLESLGFTRVYRYVAGKRDWAAAGLPREGERAREPAAGDAARPEVPTCRLADRVGAIRERVRAAGWDRCVVVADRGVVLGLLRGEALAADPGRSAEDAMEPGPQTFRPDVRLTELVEFLRQHERDSALITTSDGVLLGSLTLRDAERRT